MQASSVWNEESEEKPLSGEIQECIVKGREGTRETERERNRQRQREKERKWEKGSWKGIFMLSYLFLHQFER